MASILGSHQYMYILALIAVGMIGSATDASRNLAPNSSFEMGGSTPDAWGIQGSDGAKVIRDTGVSHKGSASIRVSIGSKEGTDSVISCPLPGVKALEEYTGTAWVKTKGITGPGACAVIEIYSDTKHLSTVQGRFSGAGDHDWMELIVHAMIPDGADNIRFELVVRGKGTAWFDDVSLTRTLDAPREFAGNEIGLNLRSNDVLCKNFLGFGAQGDYFLTCSFNVRRGVSDNDRKLVLDRIRAMRPHIIRTFFDYKWWEPEEGIHTPNSEAMRDYVGWLRFLKEIGCQVMLNPWGDCFAYSAWMNPGQSRLPDPEKRDAMVRSLVDLIQYLRVDQGLTNLSYVALMNEPDNDPGRLPPINEFVRLNKLLDSMLKERNLRKGVFLVGIDGSSWNHADPGEWFYEVASRGIGYADGCASHTYGNKVVPSLIPWVRSRMDVLKRQARGKPPKPFMITEFSTYGDTFRCFENDTYEHGLFLSDFAVTALCEGTSCLLMWCLFDTYYNDVNEQEYGLWRYKDKGWEPRPGFYSWSLITRYTKPGSRVVAVETDPSKLIAHSVALVSPEGKITILVVNRYGRSLNARLRTGLDRESRFKVFHYTRESIPTRDRGMIAASDVITVSPGEEVKIHLPPESFTLLTELE